MSNILSLEEVSKLLGKPEAVIRRYARESLLTPCKNAEGKNDKELQFDEGEVKRYLEISKKFMN